MSGEPLQLAAPSSPLRRRDKFNHLPVISPVDAEVPTIHGKHLRARVPLAQNHNRSISQVHLVVTRHQRAEARPVSRKLEVQPNGVAFEQLKQSIDIYVVCTQEAGHLGEDRLGGQHRSTHLLHQRDGPGVVRIIAV